MPAASQGLLVGFAMLYAYRLMGLEQFQQQNSGVAICCVHAVGAMQQPPWLCDINDDTSDCCHSRLQLKRATCRQSDQPAGPPNWCSHYSRNVYTRVALAAVYLTLALSRL